MFVRIYHWAHSGGAPRGASGEVLAPENVPCVLLLSRGLGTGSAFLQTWHLGTKPVSVPRPSAPSCPDVLGLGQGRCCWRALEPLGRSGDHMPEASGGPALRPPRPVPLKASVRRAQAQACSRPRTPPAQHFRCLFQGLAVLTERDCSTGIVFHTHPAV